MENNQKLCFYAINESNDYHTSGALRFLKQNQKINYPCIILLRQNNWNDNGYISHFYAYYKKDEKESLQNLGVIKIIQSKPIEKKTELPLNFYNLDNTKFFSRGFPEFIMSINSLGELKKNILKSLNEVDFCQYTKEQILKFDFSLLDSYETSLFRYDSYDLETSSKYAQHSMNLLNKIKDCEQNLQKIDEGNRTFMTNLLYGSTVATLESYLGDAFKYNVINNKSYFYSFLKNYKFQRGISKYSLKELGLQGNEIGEYIEKETQRVMNEIIFHRLDLVKELYEQILNITLPEILRDFEEAVSKRHDIFHRNGKTLKGEDLNISSFELLSLVDKVNKFIIRTERIFETQK